MRLALVDVDVLALASTARLDDVALHVVGRKQGGEFRCIVTCDVPL